MIRSRLLLGAGAVVAAAGLGLLYLRTRARPVVTSVSRATARRLHILVGPSEADSAGALRDLAAAAVDPEQHIVRSITSSSLLNDPWSDVTACVLLVTPQPGSSFPADLLAKLASYLDKSGRIVIISRQNAVDTLSALSPLSGPPGSIRVLTASSLSSPSLPDLIRQELSACGVATVVGTQAVPTLESGFLLADEALLSTLRKKWGVAATGVTATPSKLALFSGASTPSSLGDAKLAIGLVDATSSTLPNVGFKWGTYFTQLGDSPLGRSVLHFDTVSSTQTVLDPHIGFMRSIPGPAGLVIVANRQISGRGRGKNGWISPPGSMSVTACLRYSPVPSYLVFVQYMAGLAVVEAVKGVPGYESLPLRVKWPNDIMYCPVEPKVDAATGTTTIPNAVKLGGVLVTCTSMGSIVDVCVGVGVNVSNPVPTVSLAQVAEEWSARQGVPAPAPLSVEYLLGKFLRKLNELIATLAGGGFPAVSERYYTAWLHTGAYMRCSGEDGLLQVIGVHAETGELLAKSVKSGESIGLSPGDNSFDILAGMASRKVV